MSEERASRVYSLCIVVLAVQWVFFGSLHFTFHQATKAEILSWIPFQTFIVVVTGMVEVATGILILLPKTRRWAAMSSLILLTLFLPSIYKMLAVDEAIPGSVAWRNLVRVVLVPNHVFMALCALHLWRTPAPSPVGPAQALEDVLTPKKLQPTRQPRTSSNVATPLMASVFLIANVAGFFAITISQWNHPAAFLWAMMCLASGALVGFLFGVPRINLETTKLTSLRPNSNIEVVSDWLTKIIVGVGLVEFRNISHFIRRIAGDLAEALTPQMASQSLIAEGTAFAAGLIVYFFVAGVIEGYLLTRMYISEQFKEIEQVKETEQAARSGA